MRRDPLRILAAWTRRPWLAWACALLGVGAWRWSQARDLILPSWVDSVHHTLLVRILLEQGRIPETWAPYLTEVPLYYHFGFHVTAAAVARLLGLTGLELGRAVLVTGIAWQVAVAAGVAALAARLVRSQRVGLVALLLVTFFSVMPGYYLSWGRYTLLAGLGLATWGCVAILAHRPVALALIVAATGVTHYYALALLLAFSGLYVLLMGEWRERLRLSAGVAAGVALVSPWLYRTWAWNHAFLRPPRASGLVVAEGASAAAVDVVRLLGPARGDVLLGIALVGLPWVLRDARHRPGRERAARWTLSIFAVGLALLLGPWQLGPFRPDHAAIVLFVAAVPLAAFCLTRIRPIWVMGLVVAGLCAWGGAQSLRIVDRRLTLATAADLRAITWLDHAASPEATVLIDVKPWMGLWRGADGGWWIMPLTGRRTVLPPVAYGWGPPELADLIRYQGARTYALARIGGQRDYCAALDNLMTETGAGYYYTRSQRPGQCPILRVAYHAGGVQIFALGSNTLLRGCPPSAEADGCGRGVVTLRAHELARPAVHEDCLPQSDKSLGQGIDAQSGRKSSEEEEGQQGGQHNHRSSL
jgi:hypothetical protein